jgi:NAD(P)H-hydrate epimerase
MVNPTGTPVMAKGGSGDILTGMIAGFLAQFAQADLATLIAAAVYLHGLAAEIAAKSEQTLLATDILGALPEAIISLRN